MDFEGALDEVPDSEGIASSGSYTEAMSLNSESVSSSLGMLLDCETASGSRGLLLIELLQEERSYTGGMSLDTEGVSGSARSYKQAYTQK